VYCGILLLVFLAGLVASYVQTQTMGGIARRIIFNLRNALFSKLSELPVAFFNQNKAGDLISRINNDTDKLNQFFAQALMQFLGSFFQILGAGIFLLLLNYQLGGAALVPAVVVLVITRIISSWVKRKNKESLQSLGSLSAEVQESLENFRVIVAFDRLDYFRNKFNEANQRNYDASVGAGIANNVFTPIYTLASSVAQLITLTLGIYFIQHGQLTIGLLIGFFLYVNNFYNPLRQLASVWSSLQQALAAFDRISEVLALNSNMPVMTSVGASGSDSLLEFQNISFGYPDGKEVLRDVSFSLEKGKTYALVGPTGGGKTTTASLMARLYDPTKGVVYLGGKDIRTFDPADRTRKIGFILQEPFLFSGTVRDNITYANEEYAKKTSKEMFVVLEESKLDGLLSRFENGLDTKVSAQGDSISLGQKQLIAFMRAVLRKPELLILDEATANIDTVTEQLLEEILEKLPKETTKVIIAHRLNTIENADEIFFVNGGEVTKAGSMENAVELLLHGKRKS
jgi:ATP-binding cassette subfamily B protein